MSVTVQGPHRATGVVLPEVQDLTGLVFPRDFTVDVSTEPPVDAVPGLWLAHHALERWVYQSLLQAAKPGATARGLEALAEATFMRPRGAWVLVGYTRFAALAGAYLVPGHVNMVPDEYMAGIAALVCQRPAAVLRLRRLRGKDGYLLTALELGAVERVEWEGP